MGEIHEACDLLPAQLPLIHSRACHRALASSLGGVAGAGSRAEGSDSRLPAPMGVSYFCKGSEATGIPRAEERASTSKGPEALGRHTNSPV